MNLDDASEFTARIKAICKKGEDVCIDTSNLVLVKLNVALKRPRASIIFIDRGFTNVVELDVFSIKADDILAVNFPSYSALKALINKHDNTDSSYFFEHYILKIDGQLCLTGKLEYTAILKKEVCDNDN